MVYYIENERRYDMTDDDRETLGYPKTFELGVTCTGVSAQLERAA